MTTAVEIITDAYQRLNRLSPGETLNADDAAFGFTRLNLLVDELAAQRPFLFKALQTSAAQTGNITLATGNWAAIPSGAEIISVTQDGVTVTRMTMQQYNQSYDVTTSGTPSVYAHDGAAAVYFIPVPNGQTIKIMTQTGVATFADQTTEYTLAPGYKNYLGAALAVRLASPILGKLPIELLRAEKASMKGLTTHEPMILDSGYSRVDRSGSIVNGY